MLFYVKILIRLAPLLPVRTDRNIQETERKKRIIASALVFIEMDQLALVQAFLVLEVELPFRPRFHRGAVYLPADKAFHQARFLINQFCGVSLFFINPRVWRHGRYRCGTRRFE